VIAIPESLAFYWADPINMAAVDVLSKSTLVPADLGLDEAERFEIATLAADRVRVDFSRFLRQLWAATWGVAVREFMPTARLLSYGRHQNFTTTIDPLADPSMGYAWESRGTPGVLVLPDQRELFTRIALIERDSEIGLQFYFADADERYSTTDGLELGSDWSDDGDNRRVTRQGLFRLTNRDQEVDAEPILAAARLAATTLASAL